MQIFICPECAHKSFYDPWVESAHCPRCGYSPQTLGDQPADFADLREAVISLAREEITLIYRATKNMAEARDYIIMVRRDDYLE